jgi:hypothetical protein
VRSPTQATNAFPVDIWVQTSAAYYTHNVISLTPFAMCMLCSAL